MDHQLISKIEKFHLKAMVKTYVYRKTGKPMSRKYRMYDVYYTKEINMHPLMHRFYRMPLYKDFQYRSKLDDIQYKIFDLFLNIPEEKQRFDENIRNATTIFIVENIYNFFETLGRGSIRKILFQELAAKETPPFMTKLRNNARRIVNERKADFYAKQLRESTAICTRPPLYVRNGRFVGPTYAEKGNTGGYVPLVG